MSALLELMEPILLERDRQKMAQGIQQGIEHGKILAYYDMNVSTGEIARKLQMDVRDVEAVIRTEQVKDEA